MPIDVDKLQKLAESLTLYSRHDLSTIQAEPDDAIVKLYCDPKGDDITLRQLLGPRMAFLVGRRGTGKSTLIDRAQHELRSSGTKLGCYINLKDLLDNVKEHIPLLPSELQKYANNETWNLFALRRELIRTVLRELGMQLKKRTADNIFQKFWRLATGKRIENLISALEKIEAKLNDPQFEDLTLVKEVLQSRHAGTAEAQTQKGKVEGSSKLSQTPSITAKLSTEKSVSTSTDNKIDQQFTDVLVRTFKVRDRLSEIRDVLKDFGINELFLFLDDYSELGEQSAQFITDAILAPLHQWDPFLKIKVAAYPGRMKYGEIDSTKIGHVYLDFSELYADQTDIGKKENAGANFIKRLIEPRFTHYLERDASEFFDLKQSTIADYYVQLFDASAGVPRILGWLLSYLVESHLSTGKSITHDAIRQAAARYYRDQILPQLNMVRFVTISYDSKLDKLAQYELLKMFIAKSRECASNIRKKTYKQYENLSNPPTSHLHFRLEYEKYVDFLEFNFFISKQKDAQAKNGLKSAIYALNYGLCVENSIFYGRPTGGANRSYLVETFFNVDKLIEDYLNQHKRIVCTKCFAEHDISKLPAITEFQMACPLCHEQNVCELRSFIPEVEKILDVPQEDQRPAIEISILHVLSITNNPLYSSELGAEVDCSYQQAGGRARKLTKEGLLEELRQDLGKGTKVYYKLTQIAEKKYLISVFQPKID